MHSHRLPLPQRLSGRLLPSRQRLPGRAVSALFAALAMVAVTGCGGSTSKSHTAASQPAAPVPTVTFATSANPSSIGLVVAVIKAEHLDTANGINLDPKVYTPDQAETALLTGQVEAGFFGYVSWAGSPQKESKVALLAPLQAEHGSLVVSASSPYRTFAQLKGQKIASLGPVSANYTDFTLLAAKMGLNWQSDFDHISAPPPGLVAFLKSGQVAASILYEPTATTLVSTGAYRSVVTANAQWEALTGAPLYMLATAANASFARQHPALAKKVAATVSKAVSELATERQLYSENSGILGLKSPAQIQAVGQAMSAIYTPESASQAEPAVAKQLALAARLGIIPSAPSHVFASLG